MRRLRKKEEPIIKRDACECPELRESLLAEQDPKAAMDEAERIRHRGDRKPECRPCIVWALGYVLVNGEVHYRKICDDHLLIGSCVPEDRWHERSGEYPAEVEEEFSIMETYIEAIPEPTTQITSVRHTAKLSEIGAPHSHQLVLL